ncbi:MAG: glucose-6-phosphate isomerase [Candidatus Dadabacteria bacterium]|nr:MAG: glucose-6-phosphate isomerase [Candidatus Dadabacteria bacterium]
MRKLPEEFTALPNYCFKWEEILLDFTKANFAESTVQDLSPLWSKAYKELCELEQGVKVNVDEDRMVGHYWLRAPELAPTQDITEAIKEQVKKIEDFSHNIVGGKIASSAGKFNSFILIGIGGSALGPQLLADVFYGEILQEKGFLKPYFIDNTDPDGICAVLSSIEDLEKCLVIVISKSGGTRETLNGLQIVSEVFKEKGINFPERAVAVTLKDSKLYKKAKEEKWLNTFLIWDWVGGRTSISSAVGLLPAALMGCNINQFLKGMRDTDCYTRKDKLLENPSALLASVWYSLGLKGRRCMVILPYKDKLVLFSKYLQQLVMESLGKEFNLKGEKVEEGIVVFGNKGSTDQHAYVQQLRDGLNNFFAVFIEVLEEKTPLSSAVLEKDKALNLSFTTFVKEGARASDYLQGFLLGTQKALFEKGRPSVALSLPQLNEYYLGSLIALFERAVGIYASFTNINAYHQPGVEAGKKAAEEAVELKSKITSYLREKGEEKFSWDEMVHSLNLNETERWLAFRILRRIFYTK